MDRNVIIKHLARNTETNAELEKSRIVHISQYAQNYATRFSSAWKELTPIELQEEVYSHLNEYAPRYVVNSNFPYPVYLSPMLMGEHSGIGFPTHSNIQVSAGHELTHAWHASKKKMMQGIYSINNPNIDPEIKLLDEFITEWIDSKMKGGQTREYWDKGVALVDELANIVGFDTIVRAGKNQPELIFAQCTSKDKYHAFQSLMATLRQHAGLKSNFDERTINIAPGSSRDDAYFDRITKRIQGNSDWHL